jgi:gamma-aminobutyric acid type B receptor
VIEGEINERPKSHRPSISGTLPLLLLSVLPPVIPRASWPNTEHMSIPMRRSICFSSQPHMDDDGNVRIPAIDLLNLRLTQHQNQAERSGLLNKIRGFFGSRAPSRKASTASLAPSHIANALKSHMSMLTNILPNTSTSCQVLNTNPLEKETLRRQSFTRSGNAINSSTIEIVEPELIKSRNRRRSMAFTISNAYIDKAPDFDVDEIVEEQCDSEPRVNFILPNRRRSSIIHQNSQPTLRERIRGSPRFPHRIVPTACSLNALEDTFKGKQLFSIKKSLFFLLFNSHSHVSQYNEFQLCEVLLFFLLLFLILFALRVCFEFQFQFIFATLLHYSFFLIYV